MRIWQGRRREDRSAYEKGPWNKSPISLEEKARWAHQRHRYRRRGLLRRFDWSTLAGLASCAVVRAFFASNPLPSFSSLLSIVSSSLSVPRVHRFGASSFRNCSAAEAAGAAPMYRGQAG